MAVTGYRPDGVDALTEKLARTVRRSRTLFGLFGFAGSLLLLGVTLDTLAGNPESGGKALSLLAAMLAAYGVLLLALGGLALTVSLAGSALRAATSAPTE